MKPKLSHDQKTFIIERLACCQGYKAIAREMLAVWDLEVTPKLLAGYNLDLPSVRTGGKNGEPRIAESLVVLFESTRREYLAGLISVPVKNAIWRLITLQRNVEAAEAAGNFSAVASLIAQARADSPVEPGTGAAETRLTVVMGRCSCTCGGCPPDSPPLPLPVD